MYPYIMLGYAQVLARVMAENVTFVKKLEFAEAERARALEEKEALRVEWRQQTESWFAGAAEEMKAKLLDDWGAADKLQSEVCTLPGAAVGCVSVAPHCTSSHPLTVEPHPRLCARILCVCVCVLVCTSCVRLLCARGHVRICVRGGSCPSQSTSERALRRRTVCIRRR